MTADDDVFGAAAKQGRIIKEGGKLRMVSGDKAPHSALTSAAGEIHFTPDDLIKATRAIRRGAPIGDVDPCSCNREPPRRRDCFGICLDAAESVARAIGAARHVADAAAWQPISTLPETPNTTMVLWNPCDGVHTLNTTLTPYDLAIIRRGGVFTHWRSLEMPAP